MEQLSKRKRLQHPATKPPRPLSILAIPDAPDHALLLTHIPAKLQRAEHGINADADTHLGRRIGTESQARERGSNGRRKWRCQRCRRSWVAQPEGLCLRIQQMGSQSGEEAEQNTVEKQDCRQREGQPESWRLVKRLLLATAAWSVKFQTKAHPSVLLSRYQPKKNTHFLFPSLLMIASHAFMPIHVAVNTRSECRTALAL